METALPNCPREATTFRAPPVKPVILFTSGDRLTGQRGEGSRIYHMGLYIGVRVGGELFGVVSSAGWSTARGIIQPGYMFVRSVALLPAGSRGPFVPRVWAVVSGGDRRWLLQVRRRDA